MSTINRTNHPTKRLVLDAMLRNEPIDVVRILRESSREDLSIEVVFDLAWLSFHIQEDPIVARAIIEHYGHEVARFRHFHEGWHLLHSACKYGAPLDIIEQLVDLYPTALLVANAAGHFPVDIASSHDEANDDVIALLVERSSNILHFSSLPNDTLRIIMPYCKNSDLLTFALVCRPCLDLVEAYFWEKLSTMRHAFGPDKQWMTRLSKQADRIVKQHLGVRDIGDVDIYCHCQRLLHACARQTHLYSHQCFSGVRFLRCLPDGKTLVSDGGDKLILIWDLDSPPSRRNVLDFPCPNGDPIDALHLSAQGPIVTARYCTFYVFSVQGQLLKALYMEDVRMNVSWSTVFGNNLYFVAPSSTIAPRGYLARCDLVSGKTTRCALQWEGFSRLGMDSLKLVCLGRFLLVMRGCISLDIFLRNEDLEADIMESGIYVFTQTDLLQESFYQGMFLRMEPSMNGRNMVALCETGTVNVLNMQEDGELVCLRSFTALEQIFGFVKPAMLSCGGHLYLSNPLNCSIEVFDVETGRKVGSLQYPSVDPATGESPSLEALATNGHVLFCGFSSQQGGRGSIKVFPMWPTNE